MISFSLTFASIFGTDFFRVYDNSEVMNERSIGMLDWRIWIILPKSQEPWGEQDFPMKAAVVFSWLAWFITAWPVVWLSLSEPLLALECWKSTGIPALPATVPPKTMRKHSMTLVRLSFCSACLTILSLVSSFSKYRIPAFVMLMVLCLLLLMNIYCIHRWPCARVPVVKPNAASLVSTASKLL